jgi:hypothetical protein
VFYYSALLPWSYFASSLQNATNLIVEQQRVITKVFFPRLVLPPSGVASLLLDFGVGFSFLALMLIYYGIQPTPALLALPMSLVLAILTAPHCPRRRSMAFRVQCDVPRRAPRGAIFGVVLGVRFAAPDNGAPLTDPGGCEQTVPPRGKGSKLKCWSTPPPRRTLFRRH